jgi:DNA-3-methyladenine glycosylase I
MTDSKIRCPWCLKSELEMQYHDTEWGTPLHDDDQLFEFMVLDSFQAGLSWRTILNKRENFRKAFANFNAVKISKFTEEKLETLMQDQGIVRNRLKIAGTVKNAKAFLAVQKEFGTFDQYIWQFTNGKTINHQLKDHLKPIVTSPESDAMSADLKKRGFTFVGSTICYAFMQAAGMVNDHMTTCWRYSKV